MSALREEARRWLVVGYVVLAFTVAAVRYARRAGHRRRLLRRVEAWPW